MACEGCKEEGNWKQVKLPCGHRVCGVCAMALHSFAKAISVVEESWHVLTCFVRIAIAISKWESCSEATRIHELVLCAESWQEIPVTSARWTWMTIRVAQFVPIRPVLLGRLQIQPKTLTSGFAVMMTRLRTLSQMRSSGSVNRSVSGFPSRRRIRAMSRWLDTGPFIHSATRSSRGCGASQYSYCTAIIFLGCVDRAEQYPVVPTDVPYVWTTSWGSAYLMAWPSSGPIWRWLRQATV